MKVRGIRGEEHRASAVGSGEKVRCAARFRPAIMAPMLPARRQWIVVALAILVPLAFAGFTDHAWEDYYITLRSSRNLLAGHGFVYNPGERLQTYTSPLGALVPAACLAAAGGREAAALWLYRILGAGLLGAAAWLAARRAATLRLGGLGWAVLFGLAFADAKLVDFSINGQEAALLVFFTVWLWSELEAPAGPAAGRIGAACGGLMWTRPDAFLLGAAILLPHLLAPRAAAAPATGRRTALWRGLLLGGAIYLPWFAWAWWYYGTPIPHTIIAKAQITPPVHVGDFLLLPWRTLTGRSMLMDLFLPTYWVYGSWPSLPAFCGYALSVVAAFAWLVPALPPAGRRVSLAVFLGMFYVCLIVLQPWYAPPWTVLAALAVAFAVDAAAARARAAGRTRVVAVLRGLVAAAVAVQACVLVASAWEMRVQQRVVEAGVRQPIGDWLHAHARPGDTVFLEPLGYIGYFSGLKTYDYPGLSSPEVVAAIRAGAGGFSAVIARLQPTWLVLRPFEIADPGRPEAAVYRHYELVGTWSVRPQLDAVRFLPGRGWLEHDAEFLLFRQKPAARPPAAP